MFMIGCNNSKGTITEVNDICEPYPKWNVVITIFLVKFLFGYFQLVIKKRMFTEKCKLVMKHFAVMSVLSLLFSVLM